jgi:AcrR family transcriptional regulator
VADILEAAVRVLTREGARRFTTIRVAKAAGVSVGSLYQYFPNKESILFRLQADEWEATRVAMRGQLFAEGVEPFERLRRAVRFFFHSEGAEAEPRRALADANPLIREAPEARALQARALKDFRTFIAQAVPGARPRRVAFAARFALLCLGAIAEKCTEETVAPAQLEAYAEATAELLIGSLARLPG